MFFIHLAYLSPLFLFPLLSISSTLKRFPGEMSLTMKWGRKEVYPGMIFGSNIKQRREKGKWEETLHSFSALDVI